MQGMHSWDRLIEWLREKLPTPIPGRVKKAILSDDGKKFYFSVPGKELPGDIEYSLEGSAKMGLIKRPTIRKEGDGLSVVITKLKDEVGDED